MENCVIISGFKQTFNDAYVVYILLLAIAKTLHSIFLSIFISSNLIYYRLCLYECLTVYTEP